MSNPLFSIINPAIREDRYEITHQSASWLSKVPFEIVFVGHNPPKKAMPANFKYIETNVKPSQCLEIAARNATGDYLIVTGDDLTFSKHYLTRMATYVKRLEDRKVFITSRYSLGGVIHDDYFAYDMNVPTSPIIGCGIVVKRDLWHEIGGVDRRFVSCFSDTDIQMRLYEEGYSIFITPDCIVDELIPVDMRTLFRKSGRSERKFLNSLWVNDKGFISKKRLSPVESFSDDNILSVNQSNAVAKGKLGKFKW